MSHPASAKHHWKGNGMECGQKACTWPRKVKRASTKPRKMQRRKNKRGKFNQIHIRFPTTDSSAKSKHWQWPTMWKMIAVECNSNCQWHSLYNMVSVYAQWYVAQTLQKSKFAMRLLTWISIPHQLTMGFPLGCPSHLKCLHRGTGGSEQ